MPFLLLVKSRALFPNSVKYVVEKRLSRMRQFHTNDLLYYVAELPIHLEMPFWPADFEKP